VSEGAVQRWLWLWFGLPAAIFCITAVAASLHAAGRPAVQPNGPASPFRITQWQLPAEYDLMTYVQFVGGAGLALNVGQLTGDDDVNYDRILRLLPDGAGGLKVSEQHANPTGVVPTELTNDGQVLYEPDSGEAIPELKLPATGNVCHDILPLPDAVNQAPPARLDFGYASDGHYWFVLLDARRLAVLEEPLAPGGAARLHIVQRGKPGRLVQTVDDVAVCGDAWTDGPSLIALTRSGRIYTLDRTRQRLLERPELAGLGQAALNGNRNIEHVVYSGDVLLAVSKAYDKLRLFTRQGARSELKVLDVNDRSPRGTQRGLDDGSLLDRLSGNNLSYPEQLHRLRTEGRDAPLDVVSNCPDNEISPIGQNMFVIVDVLYGRVQVVSYAPPVEITP
jgi:hypothetical protein